MKPGQLSQTAVLVCIARAIAHEQSAFNFSDPTAFELLPDKTRTRVIEYRKGPPKNFRARMSYEFTNARAAMMVVRTLFIDEAVREAGASQVVILGAGLDGRAWRMAELRNAVVFEVDHPDSQRYKRAHIGALTQTAREVKFVSVDFTRDDLSERLAAAGHDATRPTTWIWEGVVMYLTPAEVEATLGFVAKRSTPGSRLIVVYLGPGRLLLRVVGLVLRRLGEPIRSVFPAEQMRALLAKYGFQVVRDEDLPTSAARLSPAAAKASQRVRHMRMLIADSRAS
jgi:methyltransferase (TIGR00027 family)